MKILSTKVLSTEQKQLLKEASIQLIEYPAIHVDFLSFDDDIIAENAIITSQNAAKAVIEKKILIKNCFCVGERTTSYLEEHGQNVEKTKQNALELANFIVKSYKNERFWYFCNNLRRDELPNILKSNGIVLNEVDVYKTSLNYTKIDEDFDAVLFFSPSGVDSFIKENTLGNQQVFCIGETTAQEAKKYANNIHVASKPTIEQVLQQVIKYSKTK